MLEIRIPARSALQRCAMTHMATFAFRDVSRWRFWWYCRFGRHWWRGRVRVEIGFFIFFGERHALEVRGFGVLLVAGRCYGWATLSALRYSSSPSIRPRPAKFSGKGLINEVAVGHFENCSVFCCKDRLRLIRLGRQSVE